MFKKILLAVDGSVYTDAVLSYGITLAKAFQSRLHVITVADIRVFEWVSAVGADGFVPIVPSGIYQDESRKVLDEKCDKVLEKCASILSLEKLDFQTEKILGSPMDSICNRAQVADLIVMGKRGEFARWDARSLGATVEAVSRKVRKPVLVAEKNFSPIKKILVAYDGSRHANQALLFVGHLAEAFQSQITILSVADDKEAGARCCQEAKDYLQSYDIQLALDTIPGHAEKEIIDYAAKAGVDLIAMGAFGHSRLREALLGSTTEHILRFAQNSILLAH